MTIKSRINQMVKGKYTYRARKATNELVISFIKEKGFIAKEYALLYWERKENRKTAIDIK